MLVKKTQIEIDQTQSAIPRYSIGHHEGPLLKKMSCSTVD